MPQKKADARLDCDEIPSLEEIQLELTEEERAENEAASERFVQNLSERDADAWGQRCSSRRSTRAFQPAFPKTWPVHNW